MASELEDEVPEHRAHVGASRGYDLMAATQVSLLWTLGLREGHTLCDVGFGSLRAGRLLVPYLDPGNYYGIEPNRQLLEAAIEHEVGAELLSLRNAHLDHGDDFGIGRFGVKFDYILAQSIFSHTYRDLTAHGLRQIAGPLAPDGLFVGTFQEKIPIILPQGNLKEPDAGSGWLTVETGVVYSWRDWTRLLDDVGLVCRRVRWFHRRQTWFVAVHKGQETRLRAALRSMNTRLRGPGLIGLTRQRALARFTRRT